MSYPDSVTGLVSSQLVQYLVAFGGSLKEN